MNSDEKDELKSKLRRTCENYYKSSKNNSEVDEIIKKISRNKNIKILKQDKGRGVVIMDSNKYTEKCMELINTNNFRKMECDNTKDVEKSVQEALLKIKGAIGEETYRQIYPSGSNPGKFYGTAKIHKVKSTDQDKISKLPIRPIVSNIGTATHKTAQYLSKLLSPLAKSKYTIENTKDFVSKIQKMKVPNGFKLISFDVVSLFTNVPLNATIDIILRKIYVEKLVKTKIKRKNMKELLLLCTKEVPFSFNGEIYMQIDGVMMGSPLGPLFANIFMCELENHVIPRLAHKLKNWVRYVDDTFALVREGEEKYVQEELNSFHQNIQFTYELEDHGKISFLDVLVTKTDTNGSLETSVFRKTTNTDIYMNWKSHAPQAWKIATLKSLIKRAVLISSTDSALESELEHLKKAFCELNDYPSMLVDKIILDERQSAESQTIQDPEESEIEQTEENIQVALNLPYAGDKGEEIVKKMQKFMKKAVNTESKKLQLRTTYKSTRLSTRFNIKDKTKPEHLHNVVYYVPCPNKRCKDDYIGETKRRTEKRSDEHRSKDKKSHVLQHSEKTKHKRVSLKDFKILGKGYRSNFRRKISESLFIKRLKPKLNVQKESYKLALFN